MEVWAVIKKLLYFSLIDLIDLQDNSRNINHKHDSRFRVYTKFKNNISLLFKWLTEYSRRADIAQTMSSAQIWKKKYMWLFTGCFSLRDFIIFYKSLFV